MTYSNPIYSVLYIDQEEKNLAGFASAFSQDYHIYTAGSGRSALVIMEERTIQLVIANERLPDMNGISLLEKIMSLYPDCTRILQTTSGDMETLIRAVNRGIVFTHVAWPWEKENLKITIDGALEVYHLRIQNRNLGDYLQEVKQTLERKVMERISEIEQQRRNITDSIQYASRIQKALMLPSDELEKMMPSHFLLNKPKDIVSGDFYWVSYKNDKLILSVADCTGHGVPGAFMSILGINFLNEIVSGMDSPQASKILDELRARVIRALGQTGEIDESKEGMEMALCVIDFEQQMIQFSGAFRPLYLLRDGELEEIKGDRMPIGIYHPEEVPFSNKELPYEDNDLIYLSTDGFVDQIGGLQRKTFKSGRFKKLLTEICQKPLEEQKKILREEHEIWRAGQEQIDDLMILGIRLSSRRPDQF